MSKKRKPQSTIERWMQNPAFRETANEDYQELVLSELILAIMDEDEKSVRELAREAGLSPTAIQKVRSGKSKDMSVKNFLSVVEACGYHLVLEKNGVRIPLRQQI